MSKIEQLIDEIEEFIESCKPQPFSQSKVIVPKDELYELLTELRLKHRMRLSATRKIANKDKIISDAEAQAHKMLDEQQLMPMPLLRNMRLMIRAYDKAEEC